MSSGEQARTHRRDPGLQLLDKALHDGAIVLDAYARFATTVIGTLLFPFAGIAPARNAAQQEHAGKPARLPHRGIFGVAVAVLIGVVLGRRLFGRAKR
jgi:hypothetical protein